MSETFEESDRRDWLSGVELHDALRRAGVDPSDRELQELRSSDLQLLPPVCHKPLAGRGSETWHPPETVAQYLAITLLRAVKSRTQFIGENLWLAGFKVGDKYSRTPMLKLARLGDRLLSVAKWIQSKAETRDVTVAERLAEVPRMSFPGSRIDRRAQGQDRPILMGVLFDTALGTFDGYEYVPAGERLESARVVPHAFDLADSERDVALGERLNLTGPIEQTLKNIAQAIALGSLEKAMGCPDCDIDRARADVTHALRFVLAQYEAAKWMYGENAFGLRLAATIARRANPALIMVLTLGFLKLRASSDNLLSSETIRKLAETAERSWVISNYLDQIRQKYPEHKLLLSPKTVKLAMSEITANKRWQTELAKVRIFPIPIDTWNSNWPPLELYRKLKMTSPGLAGMITGSPKADGGQPTAGLAKDHASQ